MLVDCESDLNGKSSDLGGVSVSLQLLRTKQNDLDHNAGPSNCSYAFDLY